MRHIPVLWLVEHVAREMDVACAVKYLAKKRHGIDIEIRNVYWQIDQTLRDLVPAVVVYPFFYSANAVAIGDYVGAWPYATHFNLAWEEIFYKAQLKLKSPADNFTRQQVRHHAWGAFFKKYLINNGVSADHIFVNGNPAYQLYLEPYCRYYKPRVVLAKEHDLNPDARWVFVPENYRWAFMSDGSIQRVAGNQIDPESLMTLRDYCQKSLAILLAWCAQVAVQNPIEIIFRPRPATPQQTLVDFCCQSIGTAPSNLHIIKAESVREWILASDVILSSFSTSLIEAAVANKPIYMVEPLPLPDLLVADWHRLVVKIESLIEFERACLAPDGNCAELGDWARQEILARGDPISGLADHLKILLTERAAKHLDVGLKALTQRALAGYRAVRTPHGNFFNSQKHEGDMFTPHDVDRKTESWAQVLTA